MGPSNKVMLPIKDKTGACGQYLIQARLVEAEGALGYSYRKQAGFELLSNQVDHGRGPISGNSRPHLGIDQLKLPSQEDQAILFIDVVERGETDRTVGLEKL